LPGAKVEKGAMKLATSATSAAGEFAIAHNDLSDVAISKALAKNPGASIMDVAGTHVGGPSSPLSEALSEAMGKWGVKKATLGQGAFPEETFRDLPRQEGLSSTPLGARILGNTTNTGHAT